MAIWLGWVTRRLCRTGAGRSFGIHARCSGTCGLVACHRFARWRGCERLLRDQRLSDYVVDDQRRAATRKGVAAEIYLRRVLRVLPPAYVYLLVVSLWMLAFDAGVDTEGVVSAIAFCRNLFGGSELTAHFWSLSIEEQFYVVWPPLLVLTPQRFRLPLVAMMVLATPAWRWLNGAVFGHAEVNWWRADLRADGLMTGGLIALLLSRPAARDRIARWSVRIGPAAALAALLVILSGFVPSVSRLPGYGAWSPTATFGSAGVLILLLVTSHAGVLRRVMEWAPLRWVGRLSYSLYLWQQLFFFGVSGAFVEDLPWCIPASFAMASLSYYGLERPILRHRDRIIGALSRRRAGPLAE